MRHAMRRIKQTEAYKAFSRHVIQPLRLRLGYVRGRVRATAGVLHAFWFQGDNWGDALNPFLLQAISGRQVQWTANPLVPKYMAVGSIIHQVDRNTTVWGSGCISRDIQIREKPKQVCAVRGPLTREVLISHGVDVPEIYGDPALLMPCFYNPQVGVEFDIGIVPHYVDKQHPWLDRYRNSDRVCIIDVEGETLRFVRQVKRCRHIISSSLHGIICADAYGVPATWVEFSDRVIGDGFKFRDYFASIQRTEYQRVRIMDGTTVDSLVEDHVPYVVAIDREALLDACPFRPDNQ